MRVLVIGAGGMLGSDLLREWPGDELIPATRRDADLRHPAQVRSLISSHRPDWVVLAAAFTDVDGSERTPEEAYAINEGGTVNVAKSAEESGARVLYVSTDYVFDGTSSHPYEPEDAVSPLGVYGDSKAKGEVALRTYSSQWCIVRTSWLFGARGTSFPEKILSVAKTRPELKVVSDQIGSPTYTRDLVTAIRTLVKGDARGILNATNAGACSWFEFAEEILKQARLNNPIRPISTAEAARLAKRPAYSVLSPASLNSRGIFLRAWQEALPDYLQELREFGKLI
jgi:dTDP-4-dehydrorhamnose reductase